MRARSCSLVFGISLAACGGSSVGDGTPARQVESPLAEDCPAGTLLEPESGECAPVHDRQSEFQRPADEAARASEPPDLRSLRGTADGAPRQRERQLPTPGGIGAGVGWDVGLLRAATSGALYAKMTVYPNGVGTLSNFLFTTATNRTEKTVEVVGIYSSSPGGSIGVFDWSCMTSAPCQGGLTSPSWIWTKPFSQISCNIKTQDPGDGRQHPAMYYLNKSSQQSDGSWKNVVQFWDYCHNAWDTVYTHSYPGPVKDCSIDNSCGWWGPILETFMSDPQPPINELDFFGCKLVHDGTTSQLPTSETGFTTPHANWKLFFLTPNRAWGAGNN